jgi:hypothetical protein
MNSRRRMGSIQASQEGCAANPWRGAHLRQILSSYAAYYNDVRTHLALGKDAPLGRQFNGPGSS